MTKNNRVTIYLSKDLKEQAKQQSRNLKISTFSKFVGQIISGYQATSKNIRESGRPKYPSLVYLTDAELNKAKHQAKAENKSVSKFIRMAIAQKIATSSRREKHE